MTWHSEWERERERASESQTELPAESNVRGALAALRILREEAPAKLSLLETVRQLPPAG
jgi:hypothetical protein